MINLAGTLGAPPIVVPGYGIPRINMPPGSPGGAPVATINQQAAKHVQLQGGGCIGCAAPIAAAGVGDLTPPSWWGKIPLWAKITGGVALVGGAGFLIFRLTR